MRVARPEHGRIGYCASLLGFLGAVSAESTNNTFAEKAFDFLSVGDSLRKALDQFDEAQALRPFYRVWGVREGLELKALPRKGSPAERPTFQVQRREFAEAVEESQELGEHSQAEFVEQSRVKRDAARKVRKEIVFAELRLGGTE